MRRPLFLCLAALLPLAACVTLVEPAPPADVRIAMDNGALLGNMASLLLKNEGFKDIRFLEEATPTAPYILLTATRESGRFSPPGTKPMEWTWKGVLGAMGDALLRGSLPAHRDSFRLELRAVAGGYKVDTSMDSEDRDAAGVLRASAAAPGYDNVSFARRLAAASGAPDPSVFQASPAAPAVYSPFAGLLPKPALPKAPRVPAHPAPLPSPTPDRHRSNMLFGPPH